MRLGVFFGLPIILLHLRTEHAADVRNKETRIFEQMGKLLAVND